MLARDARLMANEPPPPAATVSQRLYFVDHVRVVLTILVILQHLALTYGAVGPWYYQEPVPAFSVTETVLTLFILVNQAFFMGLFFLISAYFIPASFDRKGSRGFVKDRLIRLGIPLLVYCIFLNPLAMLGYRFSNSDGNWVTSLPYWQFYIVGMTPGPLWFVQALLLFTVIYALWRHLTRERAADVTSESRALTYREMFVFVLALTVATFVIRLWIPLGMFIPIVDLPTASHLPQYIGLFIGGMLAYRRSWFMTVTDSMGRVGLAVAVVSTILLLPLALTDVRALVGGLSWQALVYALWESLFGVGVCIGLLTIFRRSVNNQGAVGRFLSANAYTVYILHAPLIVGLAFAMRGLDVYPLLKFVLAALIAVPLCFWCAALVRRLPLARHVL